MPSRDETVEAMFDEGLNHFTDEVVRVIYSKDKTARFVLLKKENEVFTYIFQQLHFYDEDEWEYSSHDIPACWEKPLDEDGVSFFKSIEELLEDIKERPKYKAYF